MSDDDYDPGYALLQLRPSFRPAFEVRAAIGALLNPDYEGRWNDKDYLWSGELTDVTFLFHSLFWEYIKSTIPNEVGGVLGMAKVKFVRYMVCYATMDAWRKEVYQDDEVLVGVFNASEHFTIILKNCNIMAEGGEVLISAAAVTEEFAEESEKLLPKRTIVDSNVQQGDGDVCGACTSLILKELMGFPLGDESVENTANVSAIYLARVFFAHLYFERNIKVDEFDENQIANFLCDLRFLPRSHPLFKHDKKEGGLGEMIRRIHENVVRERKKLRLQLRRSWQEKSPRKASPRQDSKLGQKSKEQHLQQQQVQQRLSEKQQWQQQNQKQQQEKIQKQQQQPQQNQKQQQPQPRQRQPEKPRQPEEMGKRGATRNVATKDRNTVLEMQQYDVTLFDSDEEDPLPKRRKGPSGVINKSLFRDDDSSSDDKDSTRFFPSDDDHNDRSKNQHSDIYADDSRIDKQSANQVQAVDVQNLSFSSRNLGVTCRVDWQPDPIPSASLLPEINDDEEICHSQMFMTNPKAKGKAFRFGSMYFVVLQGHESLGMTTTGVKALFSTLFHPMRPVSPYVCPNCRLQFWNPVLHMEHLRSNWNCKNVQLSSVKRIVQINPRTVNPFYFVIDLEVYFFLRMAVQQIDPANLPLNMLNPCHYPLPAPCGGRPLPHLIIQEEVKREHEQLMKAKSFYDLHSKKLARLLKLPSLYKNSRECKDWMRDRFTQYPLFLTMPFLNSNGFPDAVLVPKSASAKKSQDIEEMDDCQKFIVAFATTGEVNEQYLSLLE